MGGSYLNRGSWPSMKNYWRRRIDKKLEGYWQGWRIKALNLLLMRGNSIDSSKYKGSISRRNSNRNGRNVRRPESIFCTKSLTTEKRKSGSTKKPKMKSSDKSSKINNKLRRGSGSTKPNNNRVVRLILKYQSVDKGNFFNKFHKSKRKDVWFCYNFKKRNSKHKIPDRITTKRSKRGSVRVDSSFKI